MRFLTLKALISSMKLVIHLAILTTFVCNGKCLLMTYMKKQGVPYLQPVVNVLCRAYGVPWTLVQVIKKLLLIKVFEGSVFEGGMTTKGVIEYYTRRVMITQTNFGYINVSYFSRMGSKNVVNQSRRRRCSPSTFIN